jgi:FKBP-type peptidyl-prolyl cis-trans isomerase
MSKKLLVAAVLGALTASACKKETKPAGEATKTVATAGSGSAAGSGSGAKRTKPTVQQLPAPFDVKAPPADATKTASGLIYKMITSVPNAPKAGRNDTVKVQYTGWRPSGETFYTTRTRNKEMPMPLNSSAPGMAEALQLLGKGEKAMVWIPAEIGYRAKPVNNAEQLAYEIEVIDIEAAPPVPADVAAPPASAKKSASGIHSLVVKAGTGTEKPARWDDVTYMFTSWDATGKMLESTEMRKREQTSAPFRQPAGIEEALTSMVVGERSRFWIPGALARKSVPPPDGVFCYEIQVSNIVKKPAPPPTPSDVAAAPADAKKTASGLAYKVIKAGTGTEKPTTAKAVKVHYTGWTTDGKMFDSSVLGGKPAEFGVTGVIKGWTEGLQLMVVGDQMRFWIPEELAYKGMPGKPAGMLVFDVELLEIKDAPQRPAMPGGHGMGGPGAMGMGMKPGKTGPGATMTTPGSVPGGVPGTTKTPSSVPPAASKTPATPPATK